MRVILIEEIKWQIENTLRNFLREEGIELYVGANDNHGGAARTIVKLEAIEDTPLADSSLLSEIRIILGILGKPWQCEALVDGIYEALLPHHITHRELTVLLMSLHIESSHCIRPRLMKKRAIMHYIVENSQVRQEENELPAADANAEYC